MLHFRSHVSKIAVTCKNLVENLTFKGRALRGDSQRMYDVVLCGRHSKKVWNTAIKRISDADMLADIAAAAPYENALIALGKLNDPEHFERVFNNTKSPMIKIAAAENLIDRTNIMAGLVRLAQGQGHPKNQSRLRAAELTGNSKLREGVYASRAIDFKERGNATSVAGLEALKNVNDQELLFNIAQEARNAAVWKTALKRLEKPLLIKAACVFDRTRASYIVGDIVKQDKVSLAEIVDKAVDRHVCQHACARLGHDLDARCICMRCGAEEHDFGSKYQSDLLPSSEKGKREHRKRCERCKAVSVSEEVILFDSCSYCFGRGVVDRYSSESGQGGAWEEACESCGGRGVQYATGLELRYICYPDGSRREIMHEN